MLILTFIHTYQRIYLSTYIHTKVRKYENIKIHQYFCISVTKLRIIIHTTKLFVINLIFIYVFSYLRTYLPTYVIDI